MEFIFKELAASPMESWGSGGWTGIRMLACPKDNVLALLRKLLAVPYPEMPGAIARRVFPWAKDVYDLRRRERRELTEALSLSAREITVVKIEYTRKNEYPGESAD